MSAPLYDAWQYRRQLSQPMAELLANPFSELTRKRHIWLIVAATTTPLLSAGLIKINEGEASGFKITASVPQVATWLAFSITGFLLIEYLLGVWADWAFAKARGWSLHAVVEDVEALIKKDATARREANLARQQEMKLRTERFKTAEQEFKTRTAPINARLEEIKSQLSGLA